MQVALQVVRGMLCILPVSITCRNKEATTNFSQPNNLSKSFQAIKLSVLTFTGFAGPEEHLERNEHSNS